MTGKGPGLGSGCRHDIAERKQATEIALCLAEEKRAHSVAQAAVQARDETLAIVSHDLRAPLHAILAGVAMLEQTDLSSAGRAVHATNIEHAVEHAMKLLDGLLDVSRIQAGQFTLEPTAIDVGGLLVGVYDVFSALARQGGVRFEHYAPPGVVAIGDERRLFQALSNLADNALKHTPPGGAVTLACFVHDGVVELSVSDTGPGIPPEDAGHVFEWYWQARHKQAAGAGLGLSITKGIVEAHGGKIWLETAVGSGTTIRFTLPRSDLLPRDLGHASNQ